MNEDESMKTATYVYPPIIRSNGVTHDIKDGETPSFLYPTATYYKGSVSDGKGVRENGGVEHAEEIIKRISNVPWFKESMEQSKVPLEELIRRFCTDKEFTRIILELPNIPINQVHCTIYGYLYPYFHTFRYTDGVMFADYILQHEIYNLQMELTREITQYLYEIKEST